METQAKHTPTPWKPFYYGTEIRPCCNPSEILVTTDIESRAAVKISDKERAANIEFIVKACNDYQEMRNLLALAMDELYTAGSSTVVDEIDRFLLRGYDRELDVYYNVAEGFEA